MVLPCLTHPVGVIKCQSGVVGARRVVSVRACVCRGKHGNESGVVRSSRTQKLEKLPWLVGWSIARHKNVLTQPPSASRFNAEESLEDVHTHVCGCSPASQCTLSVYMCVVHGCSAKREVKGNWGHFHQPYTHICTHPFAHTHTRHPHIPMHCNTHHTVVSAPALPHTNASYEILLPCASTRKNGEAYIMHRDTHRACRHFRLSIHFKMALPCASYFLCQNVD